MSLAKDDHVVQTLAPDRFDWLTSVRMVASVVGRPQRLDYLEHACIVSCYAQGIDSSVLRC